MLLQPLTFRRLMRWREQVDRAAIDCTAIDPVALTMLAVNRLGPATIRTATNGKTVTIEVADAKVAQIFRAALGEMQKIRSTDRLVDIVVVQPLSLIHI